MMNTFEAAMIAEHAGRYYVKIINSLTGNTRSVRGFFDTRQQAESARQIAWSDHYSARDYLIMTIEEV